MDIKIIIIGVAILLGALLFSIIIERVQNRPNREDREKNKNKNNSAERKTK